MWNGTWPSQQWPQQHMYQNVPPDQVDWAALAKQWIQMQQQQAPPPPQQLQRPPPSHHQVPTIPTAPPRTIKPTSPPNGPHDPFHTEPPIPGGDISLGPVTIPPPPAMSSIDLVPKEDSWHEPTISEPSWSRNVEPWVPPPPPPPPGPLPAGVTFSGKYPSTGALPGQPYLASSDSGFWEAEVTKTLPFVKKEKESLLKQDDLHSSSSSIDMAKRKQLPAWIRDQLEKMDKVKQKSKAEEHSLLQVQATPPMQTFISNDDDIPEEEMIDDSQQPELNGKESSPNKSKFDTDEESEGESSSESIDEEQRQREMMLFVKNLLTEVLLDVTNQEICDIAKNTYQKFRSRAPARQLATSSALASIASGFGGGESDKESEGSDSDTDIYTKIHQMKKAFALRERKLIADLEPKSQDSDDSTKIEVEKSDVESEAESCSPPKRESSFEKESSVQELEEKSSKEKSLTPATKESSDSSQSSKEDSKRKSIKHIKKESKYHEKHKKKRKRSRSRSRIKHSKRSRRSQSSSSRESVRQSHSRDRRRSRSRERRRHKYRSSSSSSSERQRRSRSRDKYSKRRQRSYSRDSTPKKKSSRRRRHTSRSSSRGRRS